MYTVVDNRTEVDRKVNELRHRNVVKLINITDEDLAVVKTTDLLPIVTQCQARADAKFESIFLRFSALLSAQTGVSITTRDLRRALSAPPKPSTDAALDLSGEGSGVRVGAKKGWQKEQGRESIASQPPTPDEAIGELLRLGLLRRREGEAFWFAVPQQGKLAVAMRQGRTEVLTILKRSRYKELLVRVLKSKKLRRTPLDMDWHVRDLTARGLVSQHRTASGILVRLEE